MRAAMRSMKPWLVSGAVLAVTMGAHAGEVVPSGDLQAVVGSYLEIQAKLASDSIEGIKEPADAMGVAAARMGEPGAAIVTAAKAVGGASDLTSARAAFGPLSDAVIAAAKAEGFTGLDGVKIAFCPMVNQSWLQKDEQIRNPYYGSGMLTCGEFKKR